MSFLHPEFLYYMLPPLFILFFLLLTQKEAQAHFFSDEVISRLRVSANTLTLKARNALFFLMGFFMILSLAQPVINDGVVEVKAKSADIMIALDISDSMLAEDVYPNRLKLAKQKALELLKMAPNERIGVIAFARNSYLVSPLSFDHSAVGFLLKQLDTTSITQKGTDFLSMLEVVHNTVNKEGKKYLLILSDGGDESDFSKEIKYAKENNIVVFILGIGTPKGAPIKLEDGSFVKHNGEIIVSKLNEKSANLATSSGGVYIQSVKSDEDIKTMLKEMERLSEKKELKSEEIKRFIPLFYYPLGMALFILLIATSSMSKRVSVNVPSAFLFFALLFVNPHAEAGLLDFMVLSKAKEAYEKGEYEKASKLYQNYGDSSMSGQSYYNAGNSFYKQNKYDEAIKSYEKATFDDASQRAKNFANMGNAFVKQGKEDSLQKAVQSYEESLKLEEDKQTRENLQEVQKLLEKQKQEKEQEKKEDKSEQNKDDKNQKESDKKESGDSKDKKENDKSDKESDKKDDKKEDEKKQSQENNQTKEKDEKKQDLKKLDQNQTGGYNKIVICIS
ncbi:MAG: VWA domain-containing protein [Campylobacterales bacterium]|nr:VWA domain-containing protein [Campylobacterales bacterium]